MLIVFISNPVTLSNGCEFFLFSDHGDASSLFSGDKSGDEQAWGMYDTNDDIDSVWGFNATTTTKVSW